MATYSVRTGDTLEKIARQFGVSVEQILSENSVSADSDEVFPGQSIFLPPEAELDRPIISGQTDAEFPPWFTLAKVEMDSGVDEIPGSNAHNQRILEYHKTTGGASSDEVPWCSSFVNWCVVKSGFKGTNRANARSWLQWGQSLGGAQPRPGAVVVLWRGSPKSWQGHVAFYFAPDGKNRLFLLGGNQGDRVCIQSYSRAQLLDIRVP